MSHWFTQPEVSPQPSPHLSLLQWRRQLGARVRRLGLRGRLSAAGFDGGGRSAAVRGGGGVLLGQGFACCLSCD
ncbi:hypothetical protein F2Q69_00054877 [Brassica cretica]|uniref:Uncharacterized protein n=1 Tax=Brassica cretica TaxID=69181 RepID=A0A8S9N943_BRACR|nr:hypothetical protein F2Q69_00054877 [Brassica cretica]